MEISRKIKNLPEPRTKGQGDKELREKKKKKKED